MSSEYTVNLGLRKPTNRDPITYNKWDQVLNPNFDIIDTAFGLRTYTEQNYIVNNESHSLSLNKLDMKLKDLADLAPTYNEKRALAGEGTPSVANKYATKSYVRLNRKEVLFPEFPSATFNLDGGSNTGILVTDSETDGTGYIYNHYKWVSEEASFQTYDISVQWRVPETFLEFLTTALIVDICTQENTVTSNKVDVFLSKDGESSVTSSQTDKFSTPFAATWYSERRSNQIISFPSTDAILSTILVGDTLNIVIRMHSKSSKYVKIGAITILYEG